jgi:hypothetical protein
LFIAVADLSCGKVKVWDAEICVDLASNGAHCVHTLIKKSRDFSLAGWNQTRPGWFCLNSTDFNHMQSSLAQICAESNDCGYEIEENLQSAAKDLKKRAQSQ